MLTEGVKRLKKEGISARTALCDCEKLPFADNSFDAATVSFGLRNMTHKDRALSEMCRVVRPGGRVVVLEFSHCAKILKPLYDLYSFRLMPWLGAKIAADADSYRYLAESIRMHPDQKTLAAMMEQAGMSPVKWVNLTFGICAVHVGFKPLQAARALLNNFCNWEQKEGQGRGVPPIQCSAYGDKVRNTPFFLRAKQT